MSTNSSRMSNPWVSGQHPDLNYFNDAMTKTNLWNMDYSLSRVFNNPSYSLKLAFDHRSQIDVTRLATFPHIEKCDPEHRHQLELVSITDVVNKVYTIVIDHPKQDNILKALCWYLISTNLIFMLDYDFVPDIIYNTIQAIYDNGEHKPSEFIVLHKLCGSRTSAQVAREHLHNILELLV